MFNDNWTSNLVLLKTTFLLEGSLRGWVWCWSCLQLNPLPQSINLNHKVGILWGLLSTRIESLNLCPFTWTSYYFVHVICYVKKEIMFNDNWTSDLILLQNNSSPEIHLDMNTLLPRTAFIWLPLTSTTTW